MATLGLAGIAQTSTHRYAARVVSNPGVALLIDSDLKSTMSFLKQVFAEFSKNNCGTLAAALAFYMAFALPPLLYLLLMVLTFGLSMRYDDAAAEERAESVLKDQAAQMIGNEAASESIATIIENLQETSGKWWKTLISLAGILVGATGVVTALQAAMNQVWQVQIDPEKSAIRNVIRKRLLSFAMILGLGFLLLVSLVISSALTTMGDRVGNVIGLSNTVAELVNFVVQAIVVFIIFAAIFRFMPDVVLRWNDVMVGALLTTVLFLAGRYAMQIYFTYSNPAAQLGSAAASLAVFLLWVYYSAMIVLLGAEVTQVYAVRYGNGIQPESNAVRIVRHIQREPQPASA
jgi:membrane protein